ncbi:transcription factor JunD [Hemicordylus capensis]|uniref:transcription factor JunD n=1 Tax=Hemicordylus capensis TaxID=884348 RepID=UPI002304B4F0|nr:transcription factor JunD [Hemicordylus capensis]
MDIPFYHDDVLIALAAPAASSSPRSLLQPFPGGGGGGGSTMMKKDGLVLALSDQVVASLKAPGHATAQQQQQPEGQALLASPDLGLLKLASPELERLIIQSNGLVTTTPTSGGSQFHFPKGGGGAPDEQEFAAGFVKALEDLHNQNQLGVGGGPVGGELPPSAGLAQQQPPQHQPPPPPPEPPVYANLSTFAGTAAYAPEGPYAPPPPAHPRLQPPPPSLKDEPQIVPEVASFGDSPPLSPIDMDTQERIKAERKRLRNRIAASKCRRRKLERISRLEEKVKSLKSQNTELASTANLLREQVAQLKQKVLSHVNSGCQLLPQQPPPHQVPAY